MQWGYVEAEDIDEATAHTKEFHDNALESSYWAEPAEDADTNEYENTGIITAIW